MMPDVFNLSVKWVDPKAAFEGDENADVLALDADLVGLAPAQWR
jgi:hypothetical protein